MLIPNVIEQTPRGERFYDIFSRLLRDRIVFIGTPIDETVASLTIAQLLFLQSEDPTEPIQMYINSPGGSVTAGLGIYDTMQYINPEVHTWCVGMAASMAAVLLAAGEKGHRHVLPHARILIHQPWSSGISGQATDLKIQAEEILRTRDSLNLILAQHTGQPLERIENDTDRDYYMSPAEAQAYGIVDIVAEKQPEKTGD
ncbi:MAG: ATP-dependent Clp protease proteolytic subunit [Armatimonadota bacterium]